MDEEQPNSSLPTEPHPGIFSPQIIEMVSPEKKHVHWGAVLIGLVFLFTLGVFSFGGGILVSSLVPNLGQATTKKALVATSSATPEDWQTFADKASKYQIGYPKDWKATAHERTAPAGVRLEKGVDSVELWLKFDQRLELSTEQKEGLKKQETTNLEIKGQPAILTTYEYKAGNFLNIIVLPATEKTVQVTFWVSADDSEARDLTTKIVNSFEFK
ncbi:MAG: hypothetical protein Q8P13_02645 [bacterium]|nr:hypothetical protein [bacterium]